MDDNIKIGDLIFVQYILKRQKIKYHSVFQANILKYDVICAAGRQLIERFNGEKN